MTLRPMQPGDETAVSALLTTAFDGPLEAQLVSRLRADGDMALELLAEEDGRIFGYVAFVRLQEPEGWLSLSPVAVAPSRQRRGIGSDLIRMGLDQARQAGARAITVLGDPDYYTRFGFTLKAAEHLQSPFAGPHFMLYPIAAKTAGRSDRVVYPPAFSEF
ncbi:GNAT family N-acetyltransferase [Pseudooceanicola onchidii]|uniref:GNAT family N-acetyltransferase n=1 Tax=Pseudooceanicola onchidii TaxID=2562279 RepID=UPI0010AB069C|nr:N-acetyltransferase [Pseudooceanicola onchidii]